jgi:queuosine precursor transporter
MFSIQKMDLLVAIYIFCVAVAELMGSKTVHLVDIGSLKLNISIAIFVLPLIFTINDVITEVHGKARTRSVMQSGLIVVFLIMVFSVFATSLPPSGRFSATEAAYDKIFQSSARIAAASLTALILAEAVDLLVFTQLRKKLGKKSLWLRNNVSNFTAQFLDTAVFMTLAFYNFADTPAKNWAFLIGLILPYWAIKCLASVVETPLVYIGVKWLKRGDV